MLGWAVRVYLQPSPDFLNGLFEALGGIMHWTSVLALARDKQVKGTNVWATVFFNAWGIWNLWYYPHLGQWWSAAGGLVIVSANSVWIWLAWKYQPRLKAVCSDCGGSGMRASDGMTDDLDDLSGPVRCRTCNPPPALCVCGHVRECHPPDGGCSATLYSMVIDRNGWPCACTGWRP
jgi:hypothetical protein